MVNFDPWRTIQGGFRTDWAKSDRDSFTLEGDLYGETTGESVQVTNYTPPYSRIINGNAQLSGGNLNGIWTRTDAEGNDIRLQAYYDRTNRHELNFGEIRDTVDVDYLQRRKIPARQQLSWGAGVRESRGDSIQVVPNLVFIPADLTDQLYTAFFQDEIGLVERRLSLELGTKLLRTNFTGFKWEPSVRLLWTPTDTQTVWAAFTHAVRTPSDLERDLGALGYITSTPSGLPIFVRFNASRNFASEQLNGYELGYRRAVGQKLYIDIAGFFNHYNNLLSDEITGALFLEATPTPPHLLLPGQLGNGLFGTTTGAEIAPEWKPTSFWRLRGSYSFLHMTLKKTPFSTDLGTARVIAGSSPQHEISAQSSFDLPKALELDLTYRYVSALPGLAVPAYSTADVRLGWQVSRQFEVSLVGQNLLQPSHFESSYDPAGLVGIERSGYLKLTWLHGLR